ncbi:hypothetical protein LCGC14_2340050 [marine sediment metagenome]|uniref:Uncharacterized protein n=1 Tax=marine sediment metagenome TaxID=412755 RepID=A0A0F9CC66_9ZZZZ
MVTYGIIIICIGVWLISDAIYSLTLYWNAPSYEGSKRQTFRRDHWVRYKRGLLSIVLIVIGVLLIKGIEL